MCLITTTITLNVVNVRVMADEYSGTIVHDSQHTAVQLHGCSTNRP